MRIFLIILSASVVASKSLISQPATKNVFTVKKNETVSLKCPISTSLNTPIDYNDDLYDDYEKYTKRDNQLLIVQWFKDDNRLNKLTLPQRYSLNNFNNADLNIQNVKPADAGDYKCKIINGFGSVSHSFSLIISDSNGIAHYKKKAVTEEMPFVESKYSPPVFSKPQRMIERSHHKTVGSVVQFVCDSVGIPKPDIMWFKNGEILSEEDYGITRSKWKLNLKDIRLTDAGNYSCQVFNKMGYINATYKLSVAAPEIVSYQEPVKASNTTIIADMDAILNCKIKHSNSNLPSVKWMKQITKNQYDNYVSQNNLDAAQLNPVLNNNNNNNNNNDLKNFYQTNTKSPLYWPGLIPDSNDNKIDEHSSLYSLNDLIGSNKLDNQLDNIHADDLLKIKRRSVGDESVHYITLTSSPSIEQKLRFNRRSGIYISQLKIKQASVKDSGVYVCFLNGNTYAKSNLIVLPNHYVQPKSPETFSNKKVAFIPKEPIIKGIFQSFGLLVVLIPILGVVAFALASICYLKSLNKQRKQDQESSFFKAIKRSLFFCCIGNKNEEKLPQKNYYNGSAPVNREFYNQQIQTKSPSETGKTNNMSFSDTSSTTATTVPYYATVPLLESSPPPPLPNSQPPTKSLERCDSTPSMAYYKIVDNDVFNHHEQLATLPVNDCENQTSVSGSSRVYYQLAPTFNNNPQRGYNQSNQQVFNPNLFI